MISFRNISLLVLTLCFSFIANNAHALDIVVKDQDGNLVEHAVVAIAEGQIETPDTRYATMDQVDVQFAPHVLAIDQGQSVVFPNSDNFRHHVYSFSKPKQFEIKLYEGVPESPVKFDQPGVVVLGCNIHDGMEGYIFVSPWPEYTVTDATGKVVLSREPKQLAVWHPLMPNAKEPLMLDFSPAIETSKEILIELKAPAAPKPFKSFRNRYDD